MLVGNQVFPIEFLLHVSHVAVALHVFVVLNLSVQQLSVLRLLFPFLLSLLLLVLHSQVYMVVVGIPVNLVYLFLKALYFLLLLHLLFHHLMGVSHCLLSQLFLHSLFVHLLLVELVIDILLSLSFYLQLGKLWLIDLLVEHLASLRQLLIESLEPLLVLELVL